MKKQILLNNIIKYNDYKNSYDVSNNVKSLYKNVIKETKKSYIELQDKNINILTYYDNYDKQLACINALYAEICISNSNSIIHGDACVSHLIYEKQQFLQALKKKLSSYKQQDIKKNYHDYNNFITLENIIEKLVSCSMKCYYCNANTHILFKNVREESQWTLDRLNNYDEHSNVNTIICCLKCNLQRRRTNSTKFKFSKQMNIIKKID